MYRTKLCLNLSPLFGAPMEDQLRMMAEIGFDGFFAVWDDRMADYRRLADELGLLFQSVHGPITYARALWEDETSCDEGVRELIACLDDCAANGVPLMVTHVYYGYDGPARPTPLGLRCYGKVIEAAEKRGMKIAFENTEGEACLKGLLDAFRGCDTVGYCWDTGHEACYAKDIDFLARHGDQIIATHINDNLGISAFDGTLSGGDDLHLLPFDGIIDWQDAAARLARTGFDGPLTFELKRLNTRRPYIGDKYKKMTPMEFVTEAYIRACRFAAMRNRLLLRQEETK